MIKRIKEIVFPLFLVLMVIFMSVIPFIHATEYFFHYIRADTIEGVIMDYNYKKYSSSGKSRLVKKRYGPVFTYTPKGTNTVVRIEDKFGPKEYHEIGDKVVVYYIPSDHTKASLLEYMAWLREGVEFLMGCFILIILIKVYIG